MPCQQLNLDGCCWWEFRLWGTPGTWMLSPVGVMQLWGPLELRWVPYQGGLPLGNRGLAEGQCRIHLWRQLLEKDHRLWQCGESKKRSDLIFKSKWKPQEQGSRTWIPGYALNMGRNPHINLLWPISFWSTTAQPWSLDSLDWSHSHQDLHCMASSSCLPGDPSTSCNNKPANRI